MKLDINKANELLNKSGIARVSMAQPNENILFKEMINARWRDDYTGDETLEIQIDDVVDETIFEMKDLDFCLVDDSEFAYNDDGDEEEDENTVITLHVSFRMDGQYDQHIEIDGISTEDAVDEWDVAAEQMYEYRGTKDIATLRKEFEALGATYSTELEGFVT
jgi:hypothetical protein